MKKIWSLPFNVSLLKVLICFWLMCFPAISFTQIVASGDLLAKNDKVKKKRKKSSVKKTNLPTIESLISSKYEALKQKQAEQEQELANIMVSFEKENDIKEKIFDDFAYIQLNFINSVSPREFRLDSIKLFIDNESSPFYEIGPYKKQNIELSPLYFGKIPQGCHTITAKAVYTRLTNNLIRNFFVKRHEEIEKKQTFIAKSGYQNHLDIEFFKETHSIVSAYKNPYIRFNNLVKPNFLQSAPLVSLQEAINQGRLRLSYSNEDSKNYEIKSKRISIDGLLIINTGDLKQENLLYDAPLRSGKHSLNVDLVMGPKRMVKGSAYNFELSFKRDFYIVSGQTTAVDLLTLPKTGIAKNRTKTTYARVTSEIFSEQNQEFFPPMSCKEFEDLIAPKKNVVEEEKVDVIENASEAPVVEKPAEITPEESQPLEQKPTEEKPAEEVITPVLQNEGN